MATRELHVCDFCNKILVGNPRIVSIDGTEFTDVCESCVGRLNTFVKRIGTPYVPKPKKDAAEADPVAASAPPVAPTPEAPKAGLLGGRKK
jgi:ribosome-binding protein aMBF1 (putative translation factor)